MKTRLLSTALALASFAGAAFAEITVTDVEGRAVTVPHVPKRVVLGFHSEDYLAIVGPGALDKVAAILALDLEGLAPEPVRRLRSGAARPRGDPGRRRYRERRLLRRESHRGEARLPDPRRLVPTTRSASR